MQLPAMGYGLRYEYGMFKQTIQDGWQQEQPDNWLRRPDPWEVARPHEKVEVKLNCSFEVARGTCTRSPGRPSSLIGIPFDRPVVGYGGKTINTLRLWAAGAPDYFDFQGFSHGDFVGAVAETLEAESLTRVLYPDDSTSMGQGLRFVQEYFLVACSLADLVRRFRRQQHRLEHASREGRHPAQRYPSDHGRSRVDADSARRRAPRLGPGLGHHAADSGLHQPHAAAGSPGEMAGRLVRDAAAAAPGNHLTRSTAGCSMMSGPGSPATRDASQRMSLIEEGPSARVRMANLAIVGSHSTNGVAAIHSELLRTTTVKDLAEMFPERFNNKTNGVTPRRWLLLANPALARTITEAIGDGWITDLSQLSKLKPLADDTGFRDAFRKAKREAKVAVCRLAQSRHPARRSTRTPSSIARSSASTNTSGNC